MTTMRQRIVEAFDQHVLRRSALSIAGGEEVFHTILGDGRYKTALEIGTYRGVAAACMAQFCERVTTVDLIHGRMQIFGETFDRDAFWTALGVRDRIDLRLVSDDTERATLINGLKFDFAFIDGAHDPAAIVKDFDQVKKCGAVLLHDWAPDNHVGAFVATLSGAVETFPMFAFWKAAPR